MTNDLRINCLEIGAISLKRSPCLQVGRKLRAQAAAAGRTAVPSHLVAGKLDISQGLLCLGWNPVTYSSRLSESAETKPNWMKNVGKSLEAPRALQTQPTKAKAPNLYRHDLRRETGGGFPLASVTAPRRPQGRGALMVPCKMTDRFLLNKRTITTTPQRALSSGKV